MNFIFRHVKESLMARVRDYTNPYMGLIRCKFLKNKNITIISNNCWGGHCYRYFALPYDSPTIGLYIFPEDYIQLIKDLRKYMAMPLKFIKYTESKKLFKFYSKIILWQRYASWLRAYRPCIHSQWSVS